MLMTMFYPVKYIAALILLSVFPNLAECQVDGKLEMPTEFDRCEPMDNFLMALEGMPPIQAFNLITLPIASNDSPEIIRNIRENLLVAINSGVLHIDYILKELKSINHLNRYDLLITTLMAINEYTDANYVLKRGISKVLFYLLKKKFLYKNDFNIVESFGLSAQISPAQNYVTAQQIQIQNPSNIQYVRKNTDYGQYSCQAAFLEYLINRIIALQAQVPSTVPVQYVPAQIQTGRVITPVRPSIIQKVQPPVSPLSTLTNRLPPPPKTPKPTRDKVDIGSLLTLLPRPKYPLEQQMYEKFKVFLQSTELQKFLSVNTVNIQNKRQLLDLIIKQYVNSSSVSVETREVLKFYSNYQSAKTTSFNFGNLITALPQPKNTQEKKYLEIVKNLLMSKEVYEEMKNVQFPKSNDMPTNLVMVIQKLMTSTTISTTVKQALSYYYPVVAAEKSHIQFDDLVTLLPKPTSSAAQTKYQQFKSFLESHDIYVLMQNIDIKSVTSQEDLLYLVLQRTVKSTTYKEKSQIALYYRNQLATEKFGFNYYQLLNLVKVTSQNSQFVQILDSYLYTAEFRTILSRLNVTSLTEYERLKLILQSIVTKSQTHQVVQAAHFILLNLLQEEFVQVMGKYFAHLPKPASPEEQMKYDTVMTYIRTEEAYNLLSTVDLTLFSDDKFILELILRTIAESNSAVNVKEACRYYLEWAEKLENLEFITRKEIKKKFKLTEIFTDTLDLKSLSYGEKEAFKKFFKYISQIKPDSMSKFDSWDQARTRGQFMKLLFKYLLSLPTVPDEIKQSINVLNMLVKMDGKGALPP